MRTLVWVAGGIVLGLIIHLVSILILPKVVSNGVFARVSALGALNNTVVLDTPGPGEPNPFDLDPKFAYAVCQLDLSNGPGTMRGLLPDAFWSVSAYAPSGVPLYSTTNRSSATSVLDLAVFTPEQMLALDKQEIAIIPETLIVESPGPTAFAVVRLAPSQPAMLARYRTALAQLTCGALKVTPVAATPLPPEAAIEERAAPGAVPPPLSRPNR